MYNLELCARFGASTNGKWPLWLKLWWNQELWEVQKCIMYDLSSKIIFLLFLYFFVPNAQNWVPRFVPNAHFWVPLFVPNAPFVVLRLTENRTFLMPNLFLMLIFGFPDLFLMLIFGFRGAREIWIKTQI